MTHRNPDKMPLVVQTQGSFKKRKTKLEKAVSWIAQVVKAPSTSVGFWESGFGGRLESRGGIFLVGYFQNHAWLRQFLQSYQTKL